MENQPKFCPPVQAHFPCTIHPKTEKPPDLATLAEWENSAHSNHSGSHFKHNRCRLECSVKPSTAPYRYTTVLVILFTALSIVRYYTLTDCISQKVAGQYLSPDFTLTVSGNNGETDCFVLLNLKHKHH